MDPLSLIAMASTTFRGIEILVYKGADLEKVALKLGKWYQFASDIRQAEKETENPPIFKQVFDGKSIEEEALNSVIASQKLKEQEKQIRELITYAYGNDVYREMILMRREIKARREATIYKQRRKRKMVIDTVALILGAIITISVISSVALIIRNA